jgi:hypothetical protein
VTGVRGSPSATEPPPGATGRKRRSIDDAERRLIGLFRSAAADFAQFTARRPRPRRRSLAFYDFPAEHWKHLRTTNPIESTFATVRLRTTRTKGAGSRAACLAMVFKLAQAAERRWRKLDGHELLGDVIRGVIFKNGIKAAA